LAELANVEYQDESDYAKEYNRILANIQANQDANGDWLMNVTADTVKGFIDDLNKLDGLSKEKPVVETLKTGVYLSALGVSGNKATVKVLIVVPSGHKDELLPVLKDKQDDIRKMTNDPANTKVEIYAIENDGVEDYSLDHFKSVLNSFVDASNTFAKIPDEVKGLQEELWLSDSGETPTEPSAPETGGNGSESSGNGDNGSDTDKGSQTIEDAIDAYNKANTAFTDYYNAHAKGTSEQVAQMKKFKATKQAVEADMAKLLDDEGYIKDGTQPKTIDALTDRIKAVLSDMKKYVEKEGL
jgi:hypothetical protein